MARYIDADITCRKLSYCRFQGLMRCGEGMKELMQAYNPSSVTVGFDYGTQLALEVVGSIPTADVVEVIRCKDCQNNVANQERDPLDNTDYSGEDIVCSFFMTDGLSADDYCNHGKKVE